MKTKQQMAEEYTQGSADLYAHASGEISVMPDWCKIEIATAYSSGFDKAIEMVTSSIEAKCKSKNWQLDEHWFSAEELLEHVRKLGEG